MAPAFQIRPQASTDNEPAADDDPLCPIVEVYCLIAANRVCNSSLFAVAVLEVDEAVVEEVVPVSSSPPNPPGGGPGGGP